MAAVVTADMESNTVPTCREGQAAFDVNDPGLEVYPMGTATVNLGDDDHGPCVVLYNLAPNLEFAAHYHDTDQCFVVLEGSVWVGRAWFGPGTVRVQDAGSVYGPVVSGPGGCKAVSFYCDRTALADQFATERDRRKNEELTARLAAMFEAGAPAGWWWT